MLTEIKANKEFSNPNLEISNKLTILEHLSEKPVVKEQKETVVDEFQKYDKTLRTLTYKVLLEKFNDKYDGELLDEQKQLLAHYIASFSDNALALKTFLNEEIGRLKEIMSEAPLCGEIKEDPKMVAKSKEVVQILESYSKEGISEKMLTTILKTQKLAREIATDGHNN